MEIRSLSERYADSVLRYMLQSGGEIKFSDLKFIINNYPTLEKLMIHLESDGLVTTRKELRPYKTNYAKLTPLGIKVAQKLQDIEDLMNGIAPEPEDNPSTSPEPVGQTTDT